METIALIVVRAVLVVVIMLLIMLAVIEQRSLWIDGVLLFLEVAAGLWLLDAIDARRQGIEIEGID